MAVRRYYTDWNRMSRHRILLDSGEVFTYEQIRDVVDLVKEGGWPNSNWSDAECHLWSMIKEVSSNYD